MYLLEFHYWSDVVMVGVIAIFILSLIILYYILKLYRTTEPAKCPEDDAWFASEIVFSNQTKIGGLITMATVKVDQKVSVKWPDPADKYGNATTVENVTFESADPAIASIEADPENGPYAAIVKSNGTVGATSVKISADAKVGEEEKLIEGLLTIEVTSGEAQGFGDPEVGTPADDEDED